MADLSITHVVDVSIAAVNAGINAFNKSNIAIFTPELPGDTFPEAGYSIYLSPDQVETDFGSASRIFSMAESIFDQQPNILAGGGSLIGISMIVYEYTLTFSGVAASGAFEIVFSQGTTASIAWNKTATQIQALVQAVTGLSQVVVGGSIASESLTLTMYGLQPSNASSAPTITSNTLETSGSTAITVTIAATITGETVDEAITRTKSLVQYFGILQTYIPPQAEMLASAAVTQALTKIQGFVSRTAGDISPGGQLDLLRTGSLDQSRGFYYNTPLGGTSSDQNSLDALAAYFAVGMSVNFNGSNTTSTQNLKSLAGIQPDSGLTETLYTNAEAAGADIYPSIQGDPVVQSFNANGGFWDEIYNSLAFSADVAVSVFNYLAQVSTKIVQTEPGMLGYKGAIRKVCNQYVTNQYIAPGQWNSGVYFGNQTDFLNNIASYGFYIYTQPIAQQLQTARAARQAPVAQIALKEAGAIHSGDVQININP